MDDPVQAVLQHYGPHVRNAHVVPLESTGLSGARLWRVLTPTRPLVLRRWPREHPTLQQLCWIHHVLQFVQRRGISYVPVPLATITGETVVVHAGHLWELAPWLPGRADFHQRPTLPRLASAMEALARFHLATQEEVPTRSPAPAITERYRRLKALDRGGLDELVDSIDPAVAPSMAPLAERFSKQVALYLPVALEGLAPLVAQTFELQPCIRDVWHDHVLFTSGKVTGLIDFGAMRTDAPATDIARLLGSLAGNDQHLWQAGLAAYDRLRPLDQAERRAIVALDRAGTILGGCNWIRWVFVERRDFGSDNIVEKRLRKLLARLAPDSASQPAALEMGTIDQIDQS